MTSALGKSLALKVNLLLGWLTALKLFTVIVVQLLSFLYAALLVLRGHVDDVVAALGLHREIVAALIH